MHVLLPAHRGRHPDGVLGDVRGRLRYIGLVLYDADKVLEAASRRTSTTSTRRSGRASSTPTTPTVHRAAERAGIPRDWVEAARRRPVKALINNYKVALPLHPEYRTMPMVWYIPPLSPVVDVVRDTGRGRRGRGNLFAAIDTLRIPVEYLANLFTAGDTAPSTRVLKKLAAMRSYMRDINLGRDPGDAIPAAVGMSGEEMYDMFRLLALAKYDERYVIPTAHAEQAHALEELATECSLDYEGGPAWAAGPLRRGLGLPDAGRRRELPDARRPADLRLAGRARRQGVRRVNLLNWDGKGTPAGHLPAARRADAGPP